MKAIIRAMLLAQSVVVLASCGATPPTAPRACTAERVQAEGGRVDTLYFVLRSVTGVPKDTLGIAAIVYDCR